MRNGSCVYKILKFPYKESNFKFSGAQNPFLKFYLGCLLKGTTPAVLTKSHRPGYNPRYYQEFYSDNALSLWKFKGLDRHKGPGTNRPVIIGPQRINCNFLCTNRTSFLNDIVLSILVASRQVFFDVSTSLDSFFLELC